VAKQASSDMMPTCYRHPSRQTGVSCSNCGRPICTDCMTTTSVGMRCPECAKQKTKVHTVATLAGTPQLTYALIAINVIAYVVTVAGGGSINGPAGQIFDKGDLYAFAVAHGDWWRIVTSGFMHASLLHIAFNMYFLYFLGTLLEPAIGKLRFGALYAVSLVGGSFGALLISPNSATVGASGAVFGLLGAAILAMRARGIDPMQSGLGITLLLNLAITFFPGSGISIGGHVGGLLAGGILGYLMLDAAERRRISTAAVYGVAAVMLVGLAVGAVVVAKSANPFG
jgi:membrane associated rhomboid family serine protease